MLVAGLDVGGSSVKAWLRSDPVGRQVVKALSRRPLPVHRPAPGRVEVDAGELEALCRSALGDVAEAGERAGTDYLGLTVSTLRQGFVLLDVAGEPLGPVVLNSDGRGSPYSAALEGTYATTGHWPAGELTLPKLIAVQREEPERWAATRRVLFLHDWLVWRLTGRQVTEASYACAGGMADVAARSWAFDLLAEHGIDRALLAPVVQAGTVVGELAAGWPLPATLPVVAGCGDTQLAAMGAGGLADGVITVVAGSSTPVQAATARPLADRLQRPWVSTHAAPDLWAAEGNAGYPGTFSLWWDGFVGASTGPVRQPGLLALTAAPYWSQQTWEQRPPASLLGLQPDTTSAQIGTALLDAHAYAVRGNVEDLERALGRRASAVVLCGGAAAGGPLPARVAEVLGRDVHLGQGAEGAVAQAGWALVARAVGAHAHVPGLPQDVVPAGDRASCDEPYAQWCAAHEAVRTSLAPS